MPSSKTLIIFSTLLLGVASALFFTQKEEGHEQHSEHSNHAEHLNGITAKLTAGVEAQFSMETAEPMPNEPIMVLADIESLAGEGDFKYKIHAPDGLSLYTPAEGQFYLDGESPHTLEIQFSQEPEYDMKMHLEIKKQGSENASMFTFSTLDFQKNQEELERLNERQQSYKK